VNKSLIAALLLVCLMVAAARADERTIRAEYVTHIYYEGGRPVEMLRSRHFTQGSDRRWLGGAAFYEAIARPDLVAEYHARSRRSLRMALPGAATCLVAIGTSLGVGLADPHYHRNAAGDLLAANVDPRRVAAAASVGIGLGAVGLTFVILGARHNPDPKSFAEKYLLAQEFNEALREEAARRDETD
jgi:hypothetical protein